ncbi:hypothetical protein HanPSC8_Chr10g0417511 [Helianthus annuus]|nr:hypothetical protein HanPSC8_Chr10g0417511 [Helianthus annuus]
MNIAQTFKESKNGFHSKNKIHSDRVRCYLWIKSTQTIERPDLANLFLKFLMILMCTSLFGVFN